MLCEGGEPLAGWESTDWHAMLGASLYDRVDVYVLLHAMICASLYSHQATHLPSSLTPFCIRLSSRDGVPCHKRKQKKKKSQSLVPCFATQWFASECAKEEKRIYIKYLQAMVSRKRGRTSLKK